MKSFRLGRVHERRLEALATERARSQTEIVRWALELAERAHDAERAAAQERRAQGRAVVAAPLDPAA